jgi:hypothetical protein
MVPGFEVAASTKPGAIQKSLVTHKRPVTDVNMDIADVEQA